jgi:hypothetical protein
MDLDRHRLLGTVLAAVVKIDAHELRLTAYGNGRWRATFS